TPVPGAPVTGLASAVVVGLLAALAVTVSGAGDEVTLPPLTRALLSPVTLVTATAAGTVTLPSGVVELWFVRGCCPWGVVGVRGVVRAAGGGAAVGRRGEGRDGPVAGRGHVHRRGAHRAPAHGGAGVPGEEGHGDRAAVGRGAGPSRGPVGRGRDVDGVGGG